MARQNAIAHLEKIRQDVRDEIKRRIEQRDKYSIQLTIALGAIVAISFSTINSTVNLSMVLIAAPLVSIYFTVLILYSYRVHDVLAGYLREEIEPTLAYLCGTPPEKELETYYHDKTKEEPGIRRPFFLVALWVVCILSLAYLWGAEREGFVVALIIATLVYIGAAASITCWDKRRKP